MSTGTIGGGRDTWGRIKDFLTQDLIRSSQDPTEIDVTGSECQLLIFVGAAAWVTVAESTADAITNIAAKDAFLLPANGSLIVGVSGEGTRKIYVGAYADTTVTDGLRTATHEEA